MDKIVVALQAARLIFPASEIYGGIANTYDYGHYGVLLKSNVKDAWWRAMLQERDDIVALDSAIIQHPRTWEASRPPRRLHRPARRLPHVQAALPRRPPRRAAVRAQAVQAPGRDAGVRPHRGARVQPDVRDDDRPGQGGGLDRLPAPRDGAGHLPELQDRRCSSRARSRRSASRRSASRSATRSRPGNFIFRTLEFEQMEMEFFVPPDEAQQWYEHWLAGAAGLVRAARHPPRPPAAAPARRRRALALLVARTSDVEYLFPIGWSELEGDRQPRRLRPHPARASTPARSSSTSTRRPASATSRT